MVRRSLSNPRKKEDPKIDPKDICCKNCIHAYLMRSQPWNPIVAECPHNKKRYVANTPKDKKCKFELRQEEMVIHEMIKLK